MSVTLETGALTLTGSTVFVQEYHIVPMVTQRLAAHITEYMQTLVDGDDPRRANVVKVGRYQANPLDALVYISVQGGDAENPDLRDGISSLDGFDKIAMNVPPREIGGGSLWWRSGVCQFGVYQKGMTEDESRNTAYQVLGRLCECIDTVRVSDLIDNFGEQAIKVFLTSDSIFESGGPPNNYVWRGKAHWMCLTERSV